MYVTVVAGFNSVSKLEIVQCIMEIIWPGDEIKLKWCINRKSLIQSRNCHLVNGSAVCWCHNKGKNFH